MKKPNFIKKLEAISNMLVEKYYKAEEYYITKWYSAEEWRNVMKYGSNDEMSEPAYAGYRAVKARYPRVSDLVARWQPIVAVWNGYSVS